MTVVAKFLDEQLALDARYGGLMNLDECPPLPAAVDRYLRSCARSSAGRLRANQEIRARCAQRGAFFRLLAHGYAAMPGYREAWRPDFTEGLVLTEPKALLQRWSEEEGLARSAAEEAGLDFSWQEVDRQDGHGLVIDGNGHRLWDVGVYPDDGFAVSRHGPGRVLRELAARRELLAGLDSSVEADQILIHLLVEPELS